MARYSGSAFGGRGSSGGNWGRGGGKNIIDSIIEFFSIFFSNLPELFRYYKTIIIGVTAGIIIAFFVILVSDFKNVKALADYQPDTTTKIYDKNGILISELFRQKREVVPFEKIPENLINAFIASEDNEFYSHFGVNPKGIVRAFFINVFSGSIKQGGSTITQQLSKILLTSGKRNIFRKIKEAFIALMMEVSYTKDEIMGMYLNQIFLGHGAYGVESASKIYFNKHVWELNLAECALLATLPSSPNRLSPIRHTKTSISRHRIVLAKMVEAGFITVEEAEKSFLDFWPDYLVYVSEVEPSINTWSARIDKAPWFTEHVRRMLVRKYGEEAVYSEGLQVYTTLDVNKQIAGQNILKQSLARQSLVSAGLTIKTFDPRNKEEETGKPLTEAEEERLKLNYHLRAGVIEELEGINFLTGLDVISDFIDRYKETYSDDRDQQRVEGCIISINHENGYIEAMIGGGEFSSINQLNRTIQSRRQPGSAIKPLLYSAAMETGKFTAATPVLDSPIVYLDTEGNEWMPENYEGEYYGFVRLRKALEKSINVISIRIADELGIDTVLDYFARLLKFNDSEKKTRIPRNLSIALGSFEVSPFELTTAYAIIANGGKEVIPFSIRYVKDRNGEILENMEKDVQQQLAEKAKNGTLQIIKPSTAQMMISMLRSVISAGTARHANPGRPAGGKTGTTSNWMDAWFVGFTPQLTTGLWMGYDKLGLALGTGQSAGGIAAPVWGRYMREALSRETVRDFPVYAGLAEARVCANTGLLPGPSCRSIISELFIPEFVPTETCETCSGLGENPGVIRGPGENIVKEQKGKIKRRDEGSAADSILDNINNDLLR
jgi:penicillin-binding protein 1A